MVVTGAFQPATELRGLALPATLGPQGIFASKSAFDVAWGDLLVAVFTPRGSRPMNRLFGSTLYDLLFTPLDVEDEIIEVSIREVAAQFCPHIVIQRVTLSSSTQGGVQVGVVFSLTSDPQTTTSRTVLVKKTHIGIAGGV